MSNETAKPTLIWWILMTIAAGFLVLMVTVTARSLANIMRGSTFTPPVVASAVAPTITPIEAPSNLVPPSPETALAPPNPQSHDIMSDFEKNLRAEQDRKHSYRILREQAKAHPGELGTLTEEEIRKLEKEEITGDSGYP